MKKTIILLSIILTNFLFAATAEELKKQFRERNCNTLLDEVKELVEKGEDINQLNENGDTLFTVCASQGKTSTNEIARYLSSVGAKDTGFTYYKAFKRYKYDTPKVFETKHLKVIVLDVTAYGSSEITFENKTDEHVYIKSQISDVNGNKFFFDEANYALKPYSKINGYIRAYREDKAKMPKVVNNKVSLKRQATFKYTYKGKEYELKTPVIKDEIDVIYDVNVGILPWR